MERKAHSQQFRKKRKFFLVLPLLVLPFLTFLFWALGGGQASDLQAQQQVARGGLNTELPEAYLKDDKPLDKLSYYEKAASDSAKLEELMKNDPYYMQRNNPDSTGVLHSVDSLALQKNNLDVFNGSSVYSEPNEAKVYKKLDELNAALKQSSTPVNKPDANAERTYDNSASINSEEINRLEQIMAMNKEGNGSEDTEISQLNGMMDKILDIQHPERVNEKMKKISEANLGQVFSVTANNTNIGTTLLTGDSASKAGSLSHNRFYSLYDYQAEAPNQTESIKASIYETQTLVDGSIVKLRLLNNIYINGINIPKDNFVFGLASLNGERLSIVIKNIRYKNFLFPVQLSVFDMDGLDGIYIPGAITRDVAKQSTDRAIQGINLSTLDPSIGAQAASAGIEAAKSLLSRKAKLIKVTVKAGYQVLLQDEKQKVNS